MADSPAFTMTCEKLEAASSLNQLEARGTVRLALKSAGLDARDVTGEQMSVVLQKVLPNELESRGVENASAVCETIRASVADVVVSGPTADTPDAIFARLGG